MALKKKTSVVATIVGLVALSLGVAPVAAQATPENTRTAITVDCDNIPSSYAETQAMLAGEILSVTALNCNGWDVQDNSVTSHANLFPPSGPQSDDFTISSDSVVFTVHGSAFIYMHDLSLPDDNLRIDVEVARSFPTPSGSLLVTHQVELPVVIDQFVVGQDLIDGGWTQANPDVRLGGNRNCRMEPGAHPYSTLTLDVSASGEYTFRVMDVTPLDEDIIWNSPYFPSQDLFLAVYSNFDPTNPNDNVVGCNDDSMASGNFRYSGTGDSLRFVDDQTPYFTSNLEPGRYTLVTSTYRSSSSALWATGHNSPWSSEETWTPQLMTANFELWGPEGSITVVDPAAPALANTGQDSTLWSSVMVGGAAVVALGLALAFTARRKRNSARA